MCWISLFFGNRLLFQPINEYDYIYREILDFSNKIIRQQQNGTNICLCSKIGMLQSEEKEKGT